MNRTALQSKFSLNLSFNDYYFIIPVFSKFYLSSNYVIGTRLGTRDTVANKTNAIHTLIETYSIARKRQQANNTWNHMSWVTVFSRRLKHETLHVESLSRTALRIPMEYRWVQPVKQEEAKGDELWGSLIGAQEIPVGSRAEVVLQSCSALR
jgi:hypothetical protein